MLVKQMDEYIGKLEGLSPSLKEGGFWSVSLKQTKYGI